MSQLQDRFVENPAYSIALGLLYLLPTECVRIEIYDNLPTEFAQAANLYKDDMPHSIMLSTEYSMWVRKWKQHVDDVPTSNIPNKLVRICFGIL